MQNKKETKTPGDNKNFSFSDSRRDFLKKSAFCAAGIPTVFSSFFKPAAHETGQSPNLLIVFPDQMRAQSLGFMHLDPVITPNLDRFARESVVFSQAVSNYPVCSPFRGMLMTGKFPHSNGVLANCNTDGAKNGYELKKEDRCWSDILKEKGYSLGYIGKWHLDNPHKPYVKCENNKEDFAWNEWCPPERRHGFDFWYAYGTYDQHMKPMYWDTKAARDGAQWVEQWGPEHEADTAIRFIKNKGGKLRTPGSPFALVVSMNPPHMPYSQLPKKYVSMYGSKTLDEICNRPNIPSAGSKWGKYYRRHIRNYLAMVSGVDEQFGRILDSIEELGLERDTIVLFTSDHGNCLGIHDQISKNNHYEESMRVPFLMRWPGTIKPRKENLLLSSPDIYPTLLDLMGFKKDIPDDVEGQSHAPLILTERGPRPSSQLYIWTPYGQPEWGRRGVRTHRFTMMISRIPEKPDQFVLHDNIKDKFQLENIADLYPDVVKRLTEQELIPWLKKTKDPWLKKTMN